MTKTTKPRRMARTPQVKPDTPTPKQPSRLQQLQELLTRENGATIAEMVEATGWQQHSVRGAMAGALKKRGLTINSEKLDGVRRYHAERSA